MTDRTLKQGSVIWAVVRNPVTLEELVPHPAIVLSMPESIARLEDLQLAVCSTAFTYPVQDGWFVIPTMPQPGGHPETGLSEACVAKATWIEWIPQGAVLSFSGRVTKKLVTQIIEWLRIHGQPTP